MRIAFTANGPGEVAGWFRPLVRRLYERDPDLDVHLFCVPDDYATGYEAELARRLFPSAHVYDPKTYLRVALGRAVPGLPERVDVVQYLGGDLMHALRLYARLRGGVASTYKFSKRSYRDRFARAFAVDEKNVEQLRGWQTPDERILTVGNLAIDGALLEAQQPLEAGAPHDGMLVMPGSRGYEVENLIPFFFTMALRIARERPELPIAFGLSPFTPLRDVRAAIERGGHPRLWAQRGRLIEEGDRLYLAADGDGPRFPVVRNALAAALRARLVVTIPGTKCIELATLGVPMIACTPLNAPEVITFNGPLTYLNRIPLVGVPLKRAVAVGVSRRFTYHTQPNIDAGEALVAELHGTLTAGRVAREALDRFDDRAWLERSREKLGALYAQHVGAADRMAESLIQLAGS
jgi:hypothetical protein